MKMFIKVAKLVKTSHWHDKAEFRRELIGSVLNECVRRQIKA